MRIGLVAPPWLPVPPTSYGGTEAVIDNLARGLTTLGHDVQLFTVGTSTCPVAREHLFAEPAPEMGMALPEAAHALAAYDALRDVDVIHDHTVLGAVLHRTDRSRAGHAHVVVTYHHPYTPAATKVLASLGDSAALVAISGHQARSARGLQVDAVIHHGVDLDRYHPRHGDPHDGGYLLFLGRMCPDKGVHRAVRVARRAGQRLVI
ncbi:MAG TPA: glycosyltransferase, partial [Actinomycetales bacterium]|nr:glycosyltransferase [Actinomycetales bacterium]